jgi:hypothetical protein
VLFEILVLLAPADLTKDKHVLHKEIRPKINHFKKVVVCIETLNRGKEVISS